MNEDELETYKLWRIRKTVMQVGYKSVFVGIGFNVSNF